jgi:Ca2+/H+ antiporter
MSNLLLMTGLGFFFGGINRLEQHFNATMAQTIGMLLLLAVFSLVIPTASHLMTNVSQRDILHQSRGTAVVIMISYGLWLFFQLKTNSSMFDPPSPSVKVRIAPIGAWLAALSDGADINKEMLYKELARLPELEHLTEERVKVGIGAWLAALPGGAVINKEMLEMLYKELTRQLEFEERVKVRIDAWLAALPGGDVINKEMLEMLYKELTRQPESEHHTEERVKVGITQIYGWLAALPGGAVINKEMAVMLYKELTRQPELKHPTKMRKLLLKLLLTYKAIATLVISTALIAFNTQFATDSIQGMLEHTGISQRFIGFVILPILTIDPTSIIVAAKDKMDLSVPLTLGRCMQTALMVVPLLVLIAWCMGIDNMTLEFDAFSITALFASIIIVTYAVHEGRSNW